MKSGAFLFSGAFHVFFMSFRISLNSTDYINIIRISLWISLSISFPDFIMNCITDFTGKEYTVKSIMKSF